MICFSEKSLLKLSGTSFLSPLHDSDVVYQNVFLVFMSLSIRNMIGEMKVSRSRKKSHTGNLKKVVMNEQQLRHGDNART